MSENPNGGNTVFLPALFNGEEKAVSGSSRIVVDPVTRIEGHLRLEVSVNNGKVADAWSAGTTFRGIEMILKNRDPRDAWVFAQRLCGVCTTVHAIASVRAVENALGVSVPDNARLLRNLLEGAQFVHDHVIHFYHLHALDWVDVVSALKADPKATSDLANRTNVGWANNSEEYFATVKSRLETFINSGQLGLFANGYWGHPAYKLPPEGNLLAVAHYLEALEWQSKYIRFQARLGGKNPHPQTYLVGGMAIPLDKTGSEAVTPAVLDTLQSYIQSGLDFVSKVYIPDLLLIASYYKDWASIGGGYGNFLSFGDFPMDNDASRGNLWIPSGVIYNKDISHPPVALDQAKIQEFVAHSWYDYSNGSQPGLHPSSGQTTPGFTGPQPPFDFLQVEGKYSWLKAPRYEGKPMEVGPLARVLVAYASGHARIRELVDSALGALGVGPEALFSTLGRVAARGIETLAIAEQMSGWLEALKNNVNQNNVAIHNSSRWSPSTWPASAKGIGFTEAPRGALGHWISIRDGKIENYQMIIPTTWNGSPRDAQNQRGVWEQALINTPMAVADQPLEILRTVHSFDPCMACAVHVVDATGAPLVKVSVEHG